MLYLRLAPYELSLLLALLCLVLVWQRRQMPWARCLIAALFCQTIYIAGYLCEVLTESLSGKIFWDNLQWLPSLSIVLFHALFVRAYTGKKPLPGWLLLQLGIVPIAVTILAFTNTWHHYIGLGHRIIPGWPAPALYYELGTVAWLTLPYWLGLQGMSIVTMVEYGLAQRGVFRRQALGILIGLLLPTLTFVTALLGITLAGYRDIGPLALALANVFIMWALLRQRALHLVPMARELVFEHLQAGVLVVDEARQIVDVNGSAAALFGQTPAALIGQPAAQLLARWPEVAKAVQRGEKTRCEYRLPEDSATTWLQVDVQPIADEHQSGLLILTRDISETKRAAQDALRLREEALTASQAKSRFVATLSHEIRNPLAAVMGISRLLGETELAQEQHDLLRRLEGATRHLLELLNHTLDFSKLEAGRLVLAPVDFDLGSLLSSITEMFWLSARDKGLRFSLSVAEAVPHALHGDGMRLKQILTNLVGNAIKFTDFGEVELSVSMQSQSADEVVLEFIIRDTGIGLDPAQQAALFRPFSQATENTSKRFGGTGLGLSISHQLAHLLGGELTCESQKGVGSVFRLKVKLKVRAARKQSPELAAELDPQTSSPSIPPSTTSQPSGPVSAPPVERARILLADDNQTNQLVTQKMLRRLGYDCDLASTGAAALRLLFGHPQDHYVAVLMDLQMPELDGKAAVLQLRADPRFDALPIVALTGESLPEVILDVLSCGMDDIMQKPVDLKTLRSVLKRQIKAKRGESRDKEQPKPVPKDG